jgi:hypothetical protein
MRPGQNKRMRGRNNRKGPNPLTRTYESNGPDVKIRGTAHHVAEKYLQLARDAHSSGDPVMAESYLQHAEHYFRLIAAAQLAQQQAQAGFLRGPEQQDQQDDDDEDDDFGVIDRFASPQERNAPQPTAHQAQSQPQPQAHFPPPQQSFAAPDRGARLDRSQLHDRNGGNRSRNNRDHRRDPQEQPRLDPRPLEPDAPAGGLPAFITGGSVPPRHQPVQPTSQGGAPSDSEQEGVGYHLRNRRRRRRPDGDVEERAPDASNNDFAPGE